jgi:nucleotide-binding universal stress UspA family protein
MNLEIRKIMIPTDFSESSSHAMEYGAQLAKKVGAKILLLHVIPLGSYVSAASSAPVPVEAIEALAQTARNEISKTGKALQTSHGIAVDVMVTDGPAPAVITELAKTQAADLIVMGTQGRTGLKHVLLGSVAEHVVRHSSIPVMTVRSH